MADLSDVRIKAFDITFGELTNLYKDKELIIDPDYQRLFRWTTDQRSRLVESILLGLPIPQIFTIETEDGPLELIDGLQRVSSILHFLDHELLEMEPLRLSGCDLLAQLNGKTASDLSTYDRLKVKRTPIRTVVIERSGNPILRYEMFKRLNTGGSSLSAQEIRNCTARMVGISGKEFYDFLLECAANEDFSATTDTLPQTDVESRGREELALRFFAAKNSRDTYKGNVRDWLDGYLDAVILGKTQFDFAVEREQFQDVYAVLNSKFGSAAFVRFRDDRPIGALAPAYFEAVSIAAVNKLEKLRSAAPETALAMLAASVNSEEFRRFTGPGANSLEKLNRRIALIENAFGQL